MKKIAWIGCSFTRGRYWNDQDPNEHGYNLPMLMALAKPQYQIHDYSRFSNTLPFEVSQLKTILEDHSDMRPDAIIFQATTGTRFSLSKEISESLMLSGVNGLKKDQGTLYRESIDNYFALPDNEAFTPNKESINYDHSGTLHVGPYVWRQLPDAWESKLFIDIMEYGVSVSNCGWLRQGYVLLAEAMLKESGLPYILYEQLYYKGDSGRYANVDFITHREMPDYKKYIVDYGNHFGITGNRKLLNEFILPLVDERF